LRVLGSLALAASFAFSSACEGGCRGGATPEGGGGGGPIGGSGGGYVTPPAPDIDWVPCPEQGLDAMVCADVPVPLDWTEPNGRAITVFVRHVAATTAVRGSLWLLEGGPGSPGSWMLAGASDMHAAHPELDLFIPDHRGTGSSALLTCMPQTDPPTVECVSGLNEDSDLILHVTTTDSALDDPSRAVREELVREFDHAGVG